MADRRVELFVLRLRKTAEDLRTEAQRLLEEIQDPEKQQRVKEGIRELGGWARQTAEELTVILDRAVRRAEGALTDAAARVGVKVPTRPAGSPPPSSVETPEPVQAAPKSVRKRTPRKRAPAAKSSAKSSRKKKS